MKNIFITIISCLFATLSYSQSAELYDTNNFKITDNDLWEVTVDDNGKLYLGTVKFGLITFENGKFKNENKDNSVFKGDAVTPIFKDSKGIFGLIIQNQNLKLPNLMELNGQFIQPKKFLLQIFQ